MQNLDVVIVGGGIVGLTLALALKDSPLSIAIIDKEMGDSETGDRELSIQPENRVSAISLASENIFTNLGVWADIQTRRMQSYRQMQVWEQDSFASIEFNCKEVNQPQLGHIIENQSIRKALWQAAQQQANLSIIAPARISKLMLGQQEAFISLDNEQMLTARLVVGADGSNSWVRQQAALPTTFWDYDHHAIVATIATELAHQCTARQVFSPSGPLAFLPLADAKQCSIVWSQQVSQAEGLMALDDSDFAKALTASFDARLGRCKLLTPRQVYPLKMRYARQWVKDRVALIGDAAHSIHPLAGQGANLGLLDAAALAQSLSQLAVEGEDIGAAANLRQFERWRKAEASKMIAAMEGFKRLFAGNNPLKKFIRDTGLLMVDKLPMVKQQCIQQAMGLQGELPPLAQKG